ncbi:MAG: serine/threonine protein kinase [Planctomycetes bacterium]|nr:serine/threonine protein kinase [Planctomycetota bacterium]
MLGEGAADHDRGLLQRAVARGLVPQELAERCHQAARASGRPASQLLVERGVLTAVQVDLLAQEVAGGETLAPGAHPTLATIAPSAGDATVADAATVPPPPLPAPSEAPEGDVTYMPFATTLSTGAAAPTAPQGPPRPGDVIGDFEVLAPLGQGGMGAVFRARQRSLGREVALKVLTDKGLARGAVERFLREGRAAAAVQHPHVVTTFHAGADPATGRLFIAMELVTGGDAERLAVAAGGRLPEARALEVARDAARGLVALEAAGLVHRDIKPENLFLAADGAAKLGDLGLARRQAGDDRLTQTGAVVGTPCYMAPEQARGETMLDGRTDVYALGATLLRLLTGARPFAGGSVPAILHRILDEPPPDVRALLPGVSPATAALLDRALAKDPGRRQQGAAALLADLEAALAALRAGPAAAGAAAGAGRARGAVPLVAAAIVVSLLALAALAAHLLGSS